MAQSIPLQMMAENTDTDYWNDSCSTAELEYAIQRGAVGATTNPVIVTSVLRKEMDSWRNHILMIIRENPGFTEDDVAWRLIEDMAVKGAGLLKPVFDREKGLKGRISIQTNAKFYRNAQAMIDQALRFHALAPNMQVKMPVTAAGVRALEESTRRGVNVNATVCFTVPQAIAVAEAVERGLEHRKKNGEETDAMTPVCTIMLGRVDDWLKVTANNKNILVDPAYLDLAGVAVMKNALGIFKKRGYRTRLLGAAYRNWYHVSELIGGGLIHTIPHIWQVRYNASELPIRNTAEIDPDPEMIAVMKRNFPDFVKAYDPEGMTPDEFEFYGAARRTLRGFIAGYEELVNIVRDLMLPNPDIEI